MKMAQDCDIHKILEKWFPINSFRKGQCTSAEIYIAVIAGNSKSIAILSVTGNA